MVHQLCRKRLSRLQRQTRILIILRGFRTLPPCHLRLECQRGSITLRLYALRQQQVCRDQHHAQGHKDFRHQAESLHTHILGHHRQSPILQGILLGRHRRSAKSTKEVSTNSDNVRTFSLSESRRRLLALPSAEPTNERMESRVY